MKKSHAFNVLSECICQRKNCHRRLKLRRVVKHNDTECYRCNQKGLKNQGKKHRDLSKTSDVSQTIPDTVQA